MKVKGIIATVVISGAVVIGIGYGVGTSMKKKVMPVEVVSVPSINQADYAGIMMDSSSLYGTIVSKDTQTVSLDTDHDLLKVYVTEGDRVKKGDKLLKYDMEMDKLKREAEDLTKQQLELQLDTLKKDLATMESGRMPANYGNTDLDSLDDSDGAYDLDSEDDSGDDSSSDEDSGDASYEEEDYDLTGAADTISQDASLQPDAAADESGDSAVVSDESGADGEVSADSGSGGQVIVDGSDSGDIADDSVIDEGRDDGSLEPDADTLTAVNTFLKDVNALTEAANTSWDNLSSESSAALFTEAFQIFREGLADSGETTVTDVFGQSRTVTVYQVSGEVSYMVGDATSSVLQQAYNRLCVYQFISAVRQIFPGQSGPSTDYDYQTVSAATVQIHAAVDAFYQLQSSVCGKDDSGNIVFSTEFTALNDPSFGNENYAQYLMDLVQILNSTADTIFPDATPETQMPIPDIPDTESPDLPDGGGDDWTADDLKKAIEQQKKDIKECELQIREAVLAIKDYDRTLDHEIVKANMDGIVKQAGTVGEEPASGGFIVITGKAGMYVQGNLSERSLDTLSVGDTITGTSWDTGGTFTATITEISPYPMDNGGNNYYYFDSGSDPNSSQYPFLAYIEDAEGLTADSMVELSVSQDAASASLMIDPYFVRTDSAGKSFCYVRGDDGKLEKRLVKAKDTSYGLTIIQRGLRASDYIAFPYGDDVKEGAPTEKVESLSAVSGDDIYG